MPETKNVSGEFRVNVNGTKDVLLVTSAGVAMKAVNGTPVGGTTPAAGAFTTLSTTGAVAVQTTLQLDAAQVQQTSSNGLQLNSSNGAGKILFRIAGAQAGQIGVARNLLWNGTSDPTSAVGAIVQFTGTAPTASVTDGFAMYSADQTAGNAAPHFRTEGGDVVLLFTGAALTAADGGTVNSGDATTDGVINNIRTRLGELEARMQANGLVT